MYYKMLINETPKMPDKERKQNPYRTPSRSPN